MPRHFDETLPRVNADKIKPMVKMWGANPTKMPKYDCIDLIVASLKDPQKVRAALASLQPWERNALALIKRMGGTISGKTLKTGILASGFVPNYLANRRLEEWLDSLLKRGLILHLDERNPSYFYSYGDMTVYSDERLLAQVGFPEYQPFDIQPETLPGETHFRRPTAVALDVMGILQAVENMGGVKITQSGSLRVNDVAKLRKTLRWNEDSMDVDGFLFPDPAQAWLEAFSLSNLVKKAPDGQLVLAENPAQFAQRPFNEQVRLLMEGLIRTENWQEMQLAPNRPAGSGEKRQQGRLALTLALSALPLNPQGFFPLEQFEQALFNRIGYDFSHNYVPTYSSYYNDPPEKKQRELAEWHATIRANWLKQEVPWFGKVFTTWLYFLGLVELVMDETRLVGFRLTEIGRETFHPELDSDKPAESASQASGQPAWVVQPNFEIIAYLDRVSAPQLAFLERHAERTQSQRHTAHYRLTRESVYRGLESGSSLDDFVNTLQLGSQTELSQNVLVELHEWASLRERILLRRKARLVEFPSAGALNVGLTQGLTGAVVAERFLLLNAAPPSSGWNTIDYTKPLPQNLTLTETGLIHWKRNINDLMTAAQLTQWAAPTINGDWQLRPESVATALKPGKKLTELLTLLQNRIIPNIPASKYARVEPVIPPILEIALRSWAGATYQVELEPLIVLRCPNEQVFQAILVSPIMKTFLAGYLHPNLLFVDNQQLDALRTQLNWLGWKVSDRLEIIPFHDARDRRI